MNSNNDGTNANPYEVRVGKHTVEHRHGGSRWHWAQDSHPTAEHEGLPEVKEVDSAYGKFTDRIKDFKVDVKGQSFPAAEVFPPAALEMTFRVYYRRLMEGNKDLRRKLFQTINPGSRGGASTSAEPAATAPAAEVVQDAASK